METQDIKSQLLEIADSPEFEETPTGKLMFEAAAELSRLRAEVERLREALEKLACRHVTVSPLWWQVDARKALERE